MSSVIQRSFASGEIAPALHARADLARYAIGLKTCRNMVVMRAGGATKRPGTQFVMITGTTAPFTLTILPTTLALDASTRTGGVTATLLDSLGNPVPGRAVTWETDDSSIATVASTGSLTGLVTAIGSGTTAIRARCAALGVVSNDCAVTVDGTVILVVTAGTTKSVNGTVTAYAVGGGGGGNTGSAGPTTPRDAGGGGGVSSANFSGTGTMTITVGAGGAGGATGSPSTVAMPGNAGLSVNGGDGAALGLGGGASGSPTRQVGGNDGSTSNGTDGVGVAGGGGGANGVGANATLGGGFSGTCGDGGDGLTLIHGSHVLGTFGGGGGGGASTIGAGSAVRGGGGTGGGGNGAVNGNGLAGEPNTGGGGGNGASGGSGVVLLVWDGFTTTVS